MRAVFLIVAHCFVISAVGVTAQTEEPNIDRLAAAKELMLRDIEKATEKLLKEFDDRERVARRAGNKQLIDQIDSELRSFQDTRSIPSTTEGDRYILAIRKAYQRAVNEFGRLMMLHIKNKEDNVANAIEKERDDFMAQFIRDNPGLAPICGTQWTHPQGSFELRPDGTWQEEWNDKSTHTFREVNRNRVSVELYDPTRKCRVILNSDHMTGSIGAAKLEKGYEGGWTR